MSQQFEKLTTLLKELFQLDRPDLDFGFYRIMHAKSEEITQFLEHDLLPQVQKALSQYKSADKAELEKELAEMEEQARKLEADPDTLPKVVALRRRIDEEAVDLNALEAEVYDHLYSFFRRYYSEGDFLSKRVYKPGVYTIPYEGEEVKLHWANADQYYIKTDEYLRNYTFRLRPDDQDDPMRVHFRLVDAAEGEHDNVKVDENKKRVFLLIDEGFIAEEPGETRLELAIHFEYRLATVEDWPEAERDGKSRPPAQKDLIALAEKRILAVSNADITRWIKALRESHVTTNGEVADYSRLRAHLNRYTARNTFDYFIHKDLGSFLRRELDFFIKNEVMHLDDVENEIAPRVEQYLSKIKVIRRIAGKIIEFMAQLEGFQKKLWLKKKFVVETSWCIRVGFIPEAFYEEIAANESQREEWVRLCAIDKVVSDLGTPAYSASLLVEFLKGHPTLMVDTRHFDREFVDRLLGSFDDLEGMTNGVLIHGENWQALNLLQERYQEQVKCIYIDPPYNTGNDGFIYRDSYRHSSWLTFIDGRLQALLPMAKNDSALFVSIDDNEVGNLINLIKGHSSSVELVTLITAQLNPRGRTLDKYLAKTHEYIGAFALFGGHDAIREIQKGETAQAEYRDRDEKGIFRLLELRNRNPVFNRANRPNLFFPFFSGPEGGSVTLEPDSDHTIEIYPRNSRGEDGCWTWSKTKAQAQRDELVARRARTGAWRIFRKDRLHGEDGAVATTKAKSIWIDKEINNENGKELVGHLFGKAVFDFPKSVALVERCVEIGMGADDGVFIDFFSGSGTSGHAILNLNRRDGGRRKFILVEMGDYFDTVILPRLKKVTYSPDWKDGKPKRFATTEEAERSPRILKVVRLESYEDTLNNLIPKRTSAQQDALDLPEANGSDSFKEQYLLRYMLDVETRGSQSLLNIDGFLGPTSYRLKVKRLGADESCETNIDLLETFNWLLGLKVQRIFAPQTCDAHFHRDDEGRLQLEGCLKESADGPWWFRAVSGLLPDERRALILWRKRPGGETPEGMEEDNLVLEEWFKAQRFTEDVSYDLIYVNGVCQLETLKAPSDVWEVRLIEDAFRRLMFESEEV